ncbi:MAG: glycosyltransferase family 9 protein [Lentimicrobium sp.]|nr:glycosyltransferase family 9 protein [Lentimicrobium sp.]
MKKRILIIQTASLGDVILSTALAETLHAQLPDAEIHYLIKRGYESLFRGHPFIGKVMVWDKRSNKYAGLLKLAVEVRKNQYNAVINVHRFASSGFISALSGAGIRSGFSKNPLSFFYTHKFRHDISKDASQHETERNHKLISMLIKGNSHKPGLYPSAEDFKFIEQYAESPYITLSPASLWFTKQYPEEKWIDFLRNISPLIHVMLLGSEADKQMCERIAAEAGRNITLLAGKLSFLQSAALMKGALMNYVNDSAPQHLASAVNAQVAAIFCSTVPAFGFGPLSDISHIIEIETALNCRPCGLHGYRQCPMGHFNCAHQIQTKALTDLLK